MMELFVVPFLYTSLLLTGDTPDTRRAGYYTSLAYYKQTGMDKEVSNLEDKYVPEAMQRLGIGTAVLYRVIVDHQLEFSWSF